MSHDRQCVTVAFDSPAGGLGVSLMAGMCALALARAEPSLECALVDCDFDAGGLDMVLGIETESGLRWSGVRAPLGRIEGELVLEELPKVEGLAVLSADPWAAGQIGAWEVEAALTGLRGVCDVMVMDRIASDRMGEAGEGTAADGRGAQALDAGPADIVVLLVELSVLGLARALAWLSANGFSTHADAGRSNGGRARVRSSLAPDACRVLLVGVVPRGLGAGDGRHVVGRTQAEAYLHRELVGVLPYRRSLHREILDGLGVRSVPRAFRPVVAAIVDEILKSCGGGGHG